MISSVLGPSEGRRGGGDEPMAVQNVKPNTSFLLADSASRNTIADPSPGDFNVNLGNSASGGRRILYRNMQWTQPIWTHNMTDWEIKMSFSTDGGATWLPNVYSTYATPFTTFENFAGIEKDNQEWQPPDADSYCAMIQESLRTGWRVENNPSVVALPPGIPVADFHVRYSRYRGILILLDQSSLLPGADPILFRVEKCNWLQKGHHVHGFGVRYKTESGAADAWEYMMERNQYQVGVNLWLSNATPGGIYTRFFAVSSKEICRNRKITSFSNLRTSGATNATELTIVPTSFSQLHILANYLTQEDPTVVNLRTGDALQSFRIQIVDEFGEVLEAGTYPGNPVVVYSAWLQGKQITPPFNLNFKYFSLAGVPVYDNDVITALVLDPENFFKDEGYVSARVDSGAAIAHYFEVIML